MLGIVENLIGFVTNISQGGAQFGVDFSVSSP